MLKPQVDNSGYDLVMEANEFVCHIQLKTYHLGAATARVNIHVTLAEKPSGCVVWIKFDPTKLELGPFRWLGEAPGSRFQDIGRFAVTKHTKANAQGVKSERQALRIIPRHEFETIATIGEVVERLFGPLPYADVGASTAPGDQLEGD